MSERNNNILNFPKKGNKIPAEAAGTENYPLMATLYSPKPLETVTDIMSAGLRNKRWGAVFSIAIIPDLMDLPGGPIVVPTPPHQFFDGDDLDALKARLVFELDNAIEMAKLLRENPEKFMELYPFAAANGSNGEG